MLRAAFAEASEARQAFTVEFIEASPRMEIAILLSVRTELVEVSER
jgi:hypothetical protein